jgi:hypothetical protein
MLGRSPHSFVEWTIRLAPHGRAGLGIDSRSRPRLLSGAQIEQRYGLRIAR